MTAHATLARFAAYAIALVLGISWIVSGISSLLAPLHDLGTVRSGGIILSIADTLGLTPDGTFALAQMLAGLKVLIAVYLFIAVATAACELISDRQPDDAMLDVSLFLAALAAGVAAVVALAVGEVPYRLLIEVLVCIAASGLAAFARTGTVFDLFRPITRLSLFAARRA